MLLLIFLPNLGMGASDSGAAAPAATQRTIVFRNASGSTGIKRR